MGMYSQLSAPEFVTLSLVQTPRVYRSAGRQMLGLRPTEQLPGQPQLASGAWAQPHWSITVAPHGSVVS